MSLDKAKVNCERCFRLAHDLILRASTKALTRESRIRYGLLSKPEICEMDFVSNKEFKLDVCSKSNEVYDVRNSVLDTLAKAKEKSNLGIMCDRLSNLCVECDYSSPKVKNYIHS